MPEVGRPTTTGRRVSGVFADGGDVGGSVQLRVGTGATMWSNGAVADEDPDEASPWTRDDWVPDSAVPDASFFAGGRDEPGDRTRWAGVDRGAFDEPPVEDFGERDPAAARRSSPGRQITAGAVVVALLIGSAGALLRNGDEPATDSRGASPDGSTSADATLGETTLGSPAPTSIEPSRNTIAPASTPPASTPTASTPTVTAPPAAAVGGVDGVPESVPPLIVGEAPAWVDSSVAVPGPLGSIGATEVITLSQGGVLSVTEFPSGRNRSVDVSDVGAELQLVFGDRTIVLFDSTTLVQIRDGEPVVETTLTDGVIFVQPWTGTGSFIVTTPATGPGAPEQELVLRPDGSLEPLDERLADEVVFWSRSFSPDGDALVSGPGGVYAITPQGAAQRISTGDLVATGAAHWAIEECDESLRCAYTVISWDTGEVTRGALEALSSFGFIDPITRISPDGRSIVYRADSSGSGQRRILDVASGVAIDAGRINQVVYPDAWASDSSGIFVNDRFLRFIDRATGSITDIDGLERIRTVATGPFGADSER
jgi:hypothetical protein